MIRRALPSRAANSRALTSRVAVDTTWALAYEAISMITMMASFVLLARQLGTQGYGAYVGLFALLAPFTSFTLAGVSLTVLEHTVRAGEEPGEVVRSCSTVAVAFGVGLSALVVLVGAFTLQSIALVTMALLIAAELVVNSSTFAMVASLQARYGFTTAIRVRMVGQVARFCTLIALWASGHLTLRNFAVVAFVTYSAFALWVAHVARRRGHRGRRFGRIHGRHVRSTFLYAVGIGGVNVQNDADKFVLNAYNMPVEAGLYGAAYRVTQLGLVPITALVASTHVSFLDASAASGNQLRRASRLGLVSFAYAAAFAIVIVVSAPFVLDLLEDDFAEAAHIIPWIVPMVLLRGPGTFAMNGLLGLGRNGLRTGLLLGSAGISVVLYLVLIPRHGWKGAAVGTVVSEALMFLAGWIALWVCQRRADRRPEPPLTPAPFTAEVT